MRRKFLKRPGEKITSLLICLFFYYGCNGPIGIVKDDMAPGTETALQTYRHIKDNFYRNSDEKLFIKTRTLKNPPEGYGPEFYRAVPEIDLDTYVDYGQIDAYAKDKNKVFWRSNNSDGDFIKLLEGADAPSFEVLKPLRLAKDRNKVYDRDVAVEGLKPAAIMSYEDYEKYLLKNK